MRKTVLITGATSGIGFECVRVFAKEGWRVVCLGRNPTRLNEAVGVATALGAEAMGLLADFSEPGAAADLFRRHADAIASVDALVNSAGVAAVTRAEELSDMSWEETFRINVTAAFGMVREALPFLSNGTAPSVVNISSIAGRLRSVSLSCAYSASKAALIGMTRHLAGELGPRGIRVNCVCPGQTFTPMLAEALSSDGQEALARSIPLRRLAKPEEQARVVYFLCTPDASYINGAIIDVNGGVL